MRAGVIPAAPANSGWRCWPWADGWEAGNANSAERWAGRFALRAAAGRYVAVRGRSWMNFRYQVRSCERIACDPVLDDLSAGRQRPQAPGAALFDPAVR